jgi:hypothetical protein
MTSRQKDGGWRCGEWWAPEDLKTLDRADVCGQSEATKVAGQRCPAIFSTTLDFGSMIYVRASKISFLLLVKGSSITLALCFPPNKPRLIETKLLHCPIFFLRRYIR